MRRFIFVVVLVFLVGIIGTLVVIPVEAQSLTQRNWTVVFRVKAKANDFPPPPELRIYVVVDGATEGEAAINAHRYLSGLLTTNAAENLLFLEAQQKK